MKRPYKAPIINLQEFTSKPAPHDGELEEAILGALMLNPSSIYNIIDIIRPEYFYYKSHEVIYQACLDLFDKGHKAEILSVVDQLKRNGTLDIAGGPLGVTRITNHVVSDANIQMHARIVHQYHMRRELAKLCARNLVQTYDLSIDVFDLLDLHQREFDGIGEIIQAAKTEPGDIMMKLRKKIDLGLETGGMVGIPTGIPLLDELTGGYQAGNQVIIGARTRHGKTAYAIAKMHFLTKIKNPAYDPDDRHSHWSMYPGLFCSIEMPETQVASRMISAELVDMGHYIHYSNIERGMLQAHENELVNMAMQRLLHRGFYIDPQTGLTPQQLRAKVMKYKKQYGIKWVMIDYIQLMKGNPALINNRPEQLAEIAREIKNVSKDQDIATLALSQADRNTEKGNAREPILADLKGSGGLEESADMVELLYRPEVNDPHPVDEVTGESLKGMIQVNLAKSKQGPTKKIMVPFDVATSSFGTFDAVISHVVEKHISQNQEKYFSI